MIQRVSPLIRAFSTGWSSASAAAVAVVCAALAAALALALGVGLATGAGVAAAATTPSVSMSPGAPFHNGEAITVSVGANSLFLPHSRISILECADPGGSTAELPKDDSTCDGNTIQADSVIVGANGSFSSSGYALYQLPSSTLGEQPEGQPACNASEACVLFVGEDQNDFTQPHLFSTPFSIGAGTTNSTTTTTASPSSGAGSQAGASAASGADDTAAGTDGGAATGTTVTTTTKPAGGLAFTGSSAALLWLAAFGGLLVTIGLVGRRRAPRVER